MGLHRTARGMPGEVQSHRAGHPVPDCRQSIQARASEAAGRQSIRLERERKGGDSRLPLKPKANPIFRFLDAPERGYPRKAVPGHVISLALDLHPTAIHLPDDREQHRCMPRPMLRIPAPEEVTAVHPPEERLSTSQRNGRCAVSHRVATRIVHSPFAATAARIILAPSPAARRPRDAVSGSTSTIVSRADLLGQDNGSRASPDQRASPSALRQ